MIQQFVDIVGRFRVEDKVKVLNGCLPPYRTGLNPAPTEILEWINRYGNCFKIKTIFQVSDDNAVFSFYEVKSVLDYYQIEEFMESTRIVNF